MATLWVFTKGLQCRLDGSRLNPLLKSIHLSFVPHQISLCQSLISQALEGLAYYHTYDRVFLGCSVVLGFIGWTSYVVLVILKTHASLIRNPSVLQRVRADAFMRPPPRSRGLTSFVPAQIPNRTLARVFMCAAAAIAAFLFIQKSPVTYYVYCLLPVPVWYSVLKEWVKHRTCKRDIIIIMNKCGWINL